MNIPVQSTGEAVDQARQRLESLSESAALDAQVLVANIISRDRAWVLAHPEAPISAAHVIAFEAALARLESSEPLPYVLGEWEFYGLPFTITPDVLIPRPETELLVDLGLDWLKKNPESRSVLEIGTGSGCIGVSLAVNQPDLQLLAIDVSGEALEVARVNVERHQVVEQVTLQQGDLLSGIEGKYDLVCANLPYIPTEMLKSLEVFGREPTLALDGGEQGLDLIIRLLAQAPKVLAPKGIILLEIKTSQGNSAKTAAERVFPEASIEVHPDLQGHPRLLHIQT